MQNLLTYQGEAVKTGSDVAAENREAYAKAYFDEAVNQFNKQMAALEKRALDPKENPDELLQETTKTIIDMSYICEEFERAFARDRSVIHRAQTEFRNKTAPVFSKSHFMNHARTWPRGYPGDYKMLEGFYMNTPLSTGIGYYLDKHFLSTTLAVAVRERKELLRDLLKAELERRRAPSILNIACGSCREIIELAPDIKKSGAKVTCSDFDADALSFSANRLACAGLPSAQIAFRKYNALKMVNYERNLKEFGQQDVIYSVGFFDYLQNEVLIRLLNSLYKLCSPGGKLITSFKDARRYRTQEYHWFVVWDGFYQRTEEDMLILFERAGIPRDALTTVLDRSEVVRFFIAEKQ